MLGKPTETAIYSPFSFRQIIEFIFFLPLNLVPLFGTPAFLVITGARAGPLHHYRYFKLRGLTKKEKREEIRSRRWKYTWYVESFLAREMLTNLDRFGSIALLLQLVPVLSMFFLLTTAAGSALWIIKLEEQKRIATGGPPALAVGGDVEAPPPYTDDPL
jgi:hypothetical protein